MPTEIEKVCLECTLFAPVCDGTDKGCQFVAITRKSDKPEMVKLYNRRSYVKHAEKRREAKREYVAKNPEKVKAAQERWNSRNGETRREYWRKRYQERKAAIG